MRYFWIIGISYVAVIFVILFYLLFLRPPNPQIWGDRSSIGQLIVELALIPIAVVGIIKTLTEIRKALQVPDLDLFWEIRSLSKEPEYDKKLPLCTHVLEVSINEHEETFPVIRPVLMNIGDAIATWYSIQIDFPLDLCSSQALKYDDEGNEYYSFDWWVFDAGIGSNWKFRVTRNIARLLFMSNGQVASYPNQTLILGSALICPISRPGHFKEWQIPYTIFTDRGKPKIGSLSISYITHT